MAGCAWRIYRPNGRRDRAEHTVYEFSSVWLGQVRSSVPQVLFSRGHYRHVRFRRFDFLLRRFAGVGLGQFVRLGVMDYLLKPVQEGELQSVLDRFGRTVEEAPGHANGPLTSNAILEFIHSNYGRDLPLDEVAAHAGIHPNYLCAIMKRNNGKSFVHYLRQYRMERAMEMFRDNPRVQIEKVASAVGYEQPRHFYKVFKKETGFTPGQYRDDCLNSYEE